MKKASWIAVGILSTVIGLYPILYFIIDRKFGLLASKTTELLSNNLWNIAFYTHIILGGLALLIGWLQFNSNLRNKHRKLHRIIGKLYVTSVLISGFCGLYIALFATGGIISILGFASLGIIWLTTTFLAYLAIKKGNIRLHEKFMIYSYAACFGAVTLRIWLPALIFLLDGFTVAYRLVAWLAWIPNMMVAYMIVRKKSVTNKAYENSPTIVK